jgi:DNA-directed RNA polymerase subunit RPC12/RpoP
MPFEVIFHKRSHWQIRHRTFFHNQYKFVGIEQRLKEQKLQTIKFYTIDLTRIKGKGKLRCPKCRIVISPDDETENAYTILETVMNGDCLEKIVLKCNSCGSRVHLTGFHILNQMR